MLAGTVSSQAVLSDRKEWLPILPKLTWAGSGKGGASKLKEAFLNGSSWEKPDKNFMAGMQGL